MSFRIVNPYIQSKSIAGNVIIENSSNPNFDLLGSTGPQGQQGPTGPSDGGSIVKGTGSFILNNMLSENITGTIIFDTPFSQIPVVTASTDYGTININETRTNGFDYSINTDLKCAYPQMIDMGYTGSGLTCSMVNNSPAFAYTSPGPLSSIFYYRSSTSTGTYNSRIVVATGSNNWVSLQTLSIVNENPMIIFTGNTGIRNIRANDINGDTWGASVPIAITGTLGITSQVVIVNGNPAITYYDNSNLDLRYVRASDVNASSWNPYVTVASTGNVGQFSFLFIVNGNPAVVYRDNTNGLYRYSRANDINGDTWGNAVTISTFTYTPTTVFIVDGVPAVIGNFTNTPGQLFIMKASDINGDTWNNSPVIIESPSDNLIATTLLQQFPPKIVDFNGKKTLSGIYSSNNSSDTYIGYKTMESSDGLTWSNRKIISPLIPYNSNSYTYTTDGGTNFYYFCLGFKPIGSGSSSNGIVAQTNKTKEVKINWIAI